MNNISIIISFYAQVVQPNFIKKTNMYKNATKQVRSDNGSPVLKIKLSGKQRNETRNMKHINFVPVNIQRITSFNIIKDALKIEKSLFYYLLNPCHHIKFLKISEKNFCEILQFLNI